VTDEPAGPAPAPSPKIDTSVPHSARIWNYWPGGKDNYPWGGCATRYDRGQRQWSSGRGPRLRMVLIAKVLRASTTDGIARIWLSSSSS
jgi:S-adenosyl methyltransferase